MKSSPTFKGWLAEALPESGLSKREVARRMAAKHPRGVTHDTIETARRTLNKILSGDLTPTQPTRDAIAGALERDDSPSVDDDEEPSNVFGRSLAADLHQLAQVAAVLERRPDLIEDILAAEVEA